MESVGFDGRLGLNSFIQIGQVYVYEILTGNRVQIIASQTHTRLLNGWRFCPISIPMGTIFVSYPYPNRGIPHGLSGIGSPLTSLVVIIAWSAGGPRAERSGRVSRDRERMSCGLRMSVGVCCSAGPGAQEFGTDE
jgi:hypothetical protein